MANMSAIFEHLGATAHQLPILWIAAPLTGLFIQPIVGNLSDFTWGPLGRRRPYLLVGAILAAIALVLMPHCSTLLMAAGLLWLLDASANISMVPYRAFVGDSAPQESTHSGLRSSKPDGRCRRSCGLCITLASESWLCNIERCHSPASDSADG